MPIAMKLIRQLALPRYARFGFLDVAVG